MLSDVERYDTIEEFNVEFEQLNLALVATMSIKKMKLKETNASAQLVQYRFKIREGSPEGIRKIWRKEFVEKMSFKSGVKSRGSDR